MADLSGNAPNPASKRGLGRRHILVVEDSATQAEQLRYVLEGHGFGVTVARDGEKALAAAQEERPALVVSDVMMPVMDGYELCKRIKSDPDLKEAPVILLTSLSGLEDVVKGLQCGADNFIKKPYNEKHLLSRIEYILANQELRRTQGMQVSMEVELGGRQHVISSERQQILDLLVSTYEEAVQLNDELSDRQRELARSYQSLHGLYRIAGGLNQCTTEGEVAEQALERALELPSVQAGWMILAGDGKEPRVVASLGLPPALREPGALDGECACRLGMRTGEFSQATNVLECSRLEGSNGDTQGLRYHATVPVRSGGRLLGWVNLAGKEEGLFSEEELRTLDGIGNQVAMALERAELIQSLEEKVAERTKTLLSEIERRRQIENSLRESETRLRLTTQASHIGPWDWDLRTNAFYFSPEWKQQIGYKDQEIPNRFDEWEKRLHPDDAEKTLKVLTDYLAGKQPEYEVEFRLRHKNGSYRWILTRGEVLRDAADKPYRMVGCHLDITDRKSAELAIAEQSLHIQLLHEVAVAANESDSLREAAGSILERVCGHTGWPVGHANFSAQGTSETGESEDAWYVRDPERFQSFYELRRSARFNPGEGLAGRVLANLRSEWIADVTKDAEFAQANGARGGVVRAGFGVPVMTGSEAVGVLEFFTDKVVFQDEALLGVVTQVATQLGRVLERERAAKEKQHQLDRIHALHEIDVAITSSLDLSTVLKILLDRVDRLVPYASAATVRLLNRQAHTLEPLACHNLDEGEWKQRRAPSPNGRGFQAIQGKSPVIRRNLPRTARSRTPDYYFKNRLVSSVTLPLIAKDEAVGVISLYTKDEHEFTGDEVDFLTTLAGQAAIAIHNAQLYEQMVMANKVKDEFLSVVSHELRTPLNVMTGYTGMILEGLLGEINDKQREALEKVVQRGNEQLAMINNILFATVVDTQKIHVDSHPVALGDFLHQLRSGYEVPLNKQITIDWECPSPLAVVHTDGAKLKQILQNLIDNAIKFTNKGTVTISARMMQPGEKRPSIGRGPYESSVDFAEFKVADTGVGIPQENAPFIFDKFRQGDSSEIRAFGGVGMGLYIVKKFTELLGGNVEVESESGRGSTFTVTIPSAKTER